MESGGEEKQQKPSYTYWVRKITEDAAPLPVHNKIDATTPTSHSQLGSAWNRVCSFFLLLLYNYLIITDLFILITGWNMGREES